MERLWIIGNSGAARECYWLFRDILNASASLESEMEFGGFLGWDGHPPNLKSLADLYHGDIQDFDFDKHDKFVIGLGNPALRQKVYDAMKERGASFYTLIHPWSAVTSTAKIGEANIFQRGSTVFCDVKMGNANYLNGAVNLSHDVTVGDANFFGPFSLILGNCKIGSRNLLGVRSTLLPNARIGDENKIVPGSIVYKGCGNNRMLAGNPALPMK